ncbi:MAG TPA: L-aspartate oxidase [Candidatus Brocadiia bacterium]|nr:L-aspartate oxidase [Candidatus Brocadiia bacterium]
MVTRDLDEKRYLVSFDPRRLPHAFCNVLVLGTGVAGLRAALEAAKHGDVLVVTKDRLEESSTFYAQGGAAAALAQTDSVDQHVADTLRVGQGLSDEAVARFIVSEAPQRILELVEWGAPFDREGENLALTKEGGHSHRRIVHAKGDATGMAIEQTLAARVRQTPEIRIIEHAFCLDLITEGAACCGAIIHDARWGKMMISARQTILATGGVGCLFRETTNPAVATGDGLAMAYRAGAELRDLEFMQFHPTTLYIAGASRALISEAVRGEGGYLVNDAGERFMRAVHPDAELAPRDVVSRAILDEMKRTGATCVYLDLRHLGASLLARRFPGIKDLCAKFEIDIAQDLIPVRPSAHYFLGGVTVDMQARSTLKRLFACGEVTSTGLHGANRLGSNSLIEGLVYGRQAGDMAGRAAAAEKTEQRRLRGASLHPKPRYADLNIADVRDSLRALMWRQAGIERSQKPLEDAIQRLLFWCRYVMDKEFDDPRGWELQNMLTVGTLMARAALARAESRGVHFRTDYPQRDDAAWSRRIAFRRGEPGPIIG